MLIKYSYLVIIFLNIFQVILCYQLNNQYKNTLQFNNPYKTIDIQYKTQSIHRTRYSDRYINMVQSQDIIYSSYQ